MKIRVLGCSGNATYGSDTTSFLINDQILIDAGTGVANLSIDELQNVRDIFITHSHMDHIVYLPFMGEILFDLIDCPVNIYCHPETGADIRNHIFNNAIWPDFFSINNSNGHVVFSLTNIDVEREYSVAGVTVEAAEMNHTVPSLGFRFDDGKRSFAFTGDSTTTDAFWDLINKRAKVDLLITECAFPNGMRNIADQAKHYYPKILCTDIKKYKHQTDILISHLKAGHEGVIIDELRQCMGGTEISPITEGEILV